MKEIVCMILVSSVAIGGLGLVLQESPMETLTLPFNDGFENIPEGVYPSANGWFMEFHGSSAYVTSTQASEGNKSFRQSSSGYARTDAIKVDLPDHLIYSVDVYIDSMVGNGVWVGFHEKIGSSSAYELNVVFFNTHDHTIRAKGEKNSSSSIELQNFTNDTWYNVKVDIDYTGNNMDVYIDGIPRCHGLVPESKLTSNTFVLGSSDCVVYFDEVKLSGSEPQCDPLISLCELRSLVEQLPESAFDKNPDQRCNALLNKIDAVEDQIVSGQYQEAIDKLQNDIKAKMDGFVDGNPKNDWITDPNTQFELTALVDKIITCLQSKLEESG